MAKKATQSPRSSGNDLFDVLKAPRHIFDSSEIVRLFSQVGESRVQQLASGLAQYISTNLPAATCSCRNGFCACGMLCTMPSSISSCCLKKSLKHVQYDLKEKEGKTQLFVSLWTAKIDGCRFGSSQRPLSLFQCSGLRILIEVLKNKQAKHQ